MPFLFLGLMPAFDIFGLLLNLKHLGIKIADPIAAPSSLGNNPILLGLGDKILNPAQFDGAAGCKFKPFLLIVIILNLSDNHVGVLLFILACRIRLVGVEALTANFF